MLGFNSYLSGRTISVGSLSHFSSEVEFGIPQWSVLGTYLFLIYVNDLIIAVRNRNLQSVVAYVILNLSMLQKNPSFSQDKETPVALADDSAIGTTVGTESNISFPN